MHEGSYAVRMGPPPLTVRVRPEALEPQLKRLAAVMALRGGTLEDVEEVDLRFLEKVILRPRAWQGPGAGDQGPGTRAKGRAVDLRPVSARGGR